MWRVCVWLQAGVCERVDSHSSNKSLFICFLRLPLPRANPVDPRDIEDKDFGPSMDHAPWYRQKKKTSSHINLSFNVCFSQPSVLLSWQGAPLSVSLLPFPLHSCWRPAANWPWRWLLRQIWMPMVFFLLSNCFSSHTGCKLSLIEASKLCETNYHQAQYLQPVRHLA